MPSTPFAGVLLADLLAAAGVKPGATALRFTCFDGVYSESLTLEQAVRPDMLVAYEMQDAAVTDAHGGPVRLYAAPMSSRRCGASRSRSAGSTAAPPRCWARR
ncbi:molybdopterin-dependent oxidoreductase [Actinoplanes sp. NPDC026619]|uniref:molybdopterin-dependent oxidoreductase n=1 Tax=Actinoplanes sp. NPDC026619 TaxID=3155798 RepID=UPI0033E5BAB1